MAKMNSTDVNWIMYFAKKINVIKMSIERKKIQVTWLLLGMQLSCMSISRDNETELFKSAYKCYHKGRT